MATTQYRIGFKAQLVLSAAHSGLDHDPLDRLSTTIRVYTVCHMQRDQRVLQW